MNRIEILSQWTARLDENAELNNMPLFSIDYAGQYSKWEDVTGTPAQNLSPNPNQTTLLVECDDATLALIEADVNYYVLESGVIDDETL